jgi:DNA end-binding protein Ku
MIRYEQEIRDYKELKIPNASEAKPTELKMALELIRQMTEPFDISKYKDNYTEELMKLIKARAKGTKAKEPTMRVVHKETTDIMEQLKASLATKRKKAS